MTAYDSWTDSELVDELCDVRAGLTDWEVGFVESIAKRSQTDGRSLTDGQRATARKILDELEGRAGVEMGS